MDNLDEFEKLNDEQEWMIETRIDELIDACFRYLRNTMGDEEFTSFALTTLDMSPEELKFYCGLPKYDYDDIKTNHDKIILALNKLSRDEIDKVKKFLLNNNNIDIATIDSDENLEDIPDDIYEKVMNAINKFAAKEKNR